MEPPLTRALKHLGRTVAGQQDATVDRAALVSEARTRFVAALGKHRDQTTRWPSWVQHAAFALAGAAVALASIAVFHASPRPLTFRVGDPSVSGISGQTIDATGPVPLVFSDGTNLVLDQGTSARVVALRQSGADLLVERGVVHANVVHDRDSSWTLMVGPYLVRITGTQFDAGWDAQSRSFFVRVQHGSVVVSGCALAAKAVDAGTEVRATCLEPTAVASIAPSASVARASTDVPADAGAPRFIAESVPTGMSSSTARPDASSNVDGGAGGRDPGWVTLAREKHYAQAMQQVGDRFESECQTASASELLLLADAARFGGQSHRAGQALLALRSRFPSNPLAGVAAFHLGRMALDSGRTGEGITWLQTALREQPGGPLAREAMGRLLETYPRVGRDAEAKQLASQYLSTYPNGPHAPQARALLEK